MKFFWFKYKNNYGDVMTPWLLDKLGVRYQYADKKTNEALMIGSIANHARPGVRVYGSGFIRRNDIVCAEAKWIWVRGPISRQMVLNAGGQVPELYGDAALILPEFIKPSAKIHDIGYAPHYVDFESLNQKNKIDLTGDLEAITKQITSCRKIISSSLHGIIVAHAYGIPAAWVKLSDKLSGDDMKFYDHYLSVGLTPVLSTLDNPVFQVPTEIKTDHIRRLICERP